MHQVLVYKHTYAKKKLHSCNANIYFNKECLRSNITVNFAKTKISKTSLPVKRTQNKICILRIKYEIKFMCAKMLSKFCITST